MADKDHKKMLFNECIGIQTSYYKNGQVDSIKWEFKSIIIFFLNKWIRAVFGKNKIFNHMGLIDLNPVHFFHEDNGNDLFFTEIRSEG